MSPAPIEYDETPHATNPVPFQWAVENAAGGQVRRTGTGACPVCGCTMTVQIKDTQPPQAKGGFFERRRKESGSRPVSVKCKCTTQHTGRPTGVTVGCGARITVTRWSTGGTP
ncbi:hypothetical protein [Streptomyces sp. NPDC046862]|uniref:hypothetical protein n=1 Tax=Streptomyces sp. NPDC046862 TaxID=3154603 RepID=UPI003452B8CC